MQLFVQFVHFLLSGGDAEACRSDGVYENRPHGHEQSAFEVESQRLFPRGTEHSQRQLADALQPIAGQQRSRQLVRAAAAAAASFGRRPL